MYLSSTLTQQQQHTYTHTLTQNSLIVDIEVVKDNKAKNTYYVKAFC